LVSLIGHTAVEIGCRTQL